MYLSILIPGTCINFLPTNTLVIGQSQKIEAAIGKVGRLAVGNYDEAFPISRIRNIVLKWVTFTKPPKNQFSELPQRGPM